MVRKRVVLGLLVLVALGTVPLLAIRRRSVEPPRSPAEPERAVPASLDQVVAELRAALREAPDRVAARALLSKAHLLRGELRLARAEAEMAIATGRSPAVAFRVRAAVREAAGDLEGARLDRRRVLIREPDDPKAWLEAAATFARYAELAWCRDAAATAREYLAEAGSRLAEVGEHLPELEIEVPGEPGRGAAPSGVRAALAADVLALLRRDPPQTVRARLVVDRYLLRWPDCSRGRAFDTLVVPAPSHDLPRLDDPEQPADVCLARGRVLLDAGEPTLARVWFERACARSEDELAAWAHLAESLATVRATETVLAMYARCDRHHPGAPTAPFFLGAFHLAAGDASAALDQFEVAHRRAQGDATVLRALTVAAIRARRQTHVRPLVEASGTPASELLLGLLAESRGARDEAVSRFSACIARGVESEAAHAGLARLGRATPYRDGPEGVPAALALERGIEHLREGNVVIAGPWVQHAAAAAPGDLRARLAELHLARQQRRLDALRTRLEAETRLRPRDPLPPFLLATAEKAVGRREAARGHYFEALRRDPRCGVAANGLAWLLATDFGRPQDALAFARAARRALPDDPRVADTLGWTLFLLDDASGAIPELERAAAALPDDPGVRRRLRRARETETPTGGSR